MHQILKLYTKDFFVIYFDNILVYKHNIKSYLKHLGIILESLGSKKLYANLRKCEFLTNQLLFLEFIIG